MDLVTYYRVDLVDGITVEERPSGYYRDSPEYDRSVFKNMRRAKAVFGQASKREIQRLRALQRAVRPLSNREQLKARAFSPHSTEI